MIKDGLGNVREVKRYAMSTFFEYKVGLDAIQSNPDYSGQKMGKDIVGKVGITSCMAHLD